MPRPDRGGQSPVGLAFLDLLEILQLCVTRKSSAKGKLGLWPHPQGSAPGMGQKAVEACPTPHPPRAGHYLVGLGLTGEGRSRLCPTLQAGSQLPSALLGGRGGSAPEEPLLRQALSPLSSGCRGQCLQGQKPGAPWPGPASSGCCSWSCSCPRWGLRTCWACRTPPRPGCTSWHCLGGEAS